MDLTRVDLATEEDKENKLDEWCRLFRAETWEDMKMLAENNVVIGKAVSDVWQLTEEEMIREQCRAREEWIINDKWKTDTIAKQSEQIAQQSEQIAQLSEEILRLKAKDQEIEELKKELETVQRQLSESQC